jgi:hypothetical protein
LYFFSVRSVFSVVEKECLVTLIYLIIR